jgi:tRNA(Ile)-lysidine synthase
VAHHADDQAETILFRALRGTALRGLAGMRSRRVLESPVELVRPLLTISRSEIEQYASRAGLAWREDASNSETVYRRNFIRHEVLPAAREKINPKAGEALCRLGQLAADAEEALHTLATDLLKKSRRPSQDGQLVLDARALRSAPGYLRRAVLHRALQSLGLPQRDVSTQHLEQLDALLATADGQMNLPGNGSAQMQKKRLVLTAG